MHAMTLPAADAAVEILLVEDSATQAEQLRHILEQQGYRVVVAGNGREALGMLAQRQPALVISDILMPEVDGYELTRRLKADPGLQHVPVILLTSLSDPGAVLKGLECGADNFVTKPYRESDLLPRIHSALARRYDTADGHAAIEVSFAGERHFITAERQQLLDVLLSTYETAVEKNQELTRAEEDLRELNRTLEKKVEERTAELRAEIARRRRTEELLRGEKAFVDAIIDSAPETFYVVDSAGRYVRWKDGFNEQMEPSAEGRPARRSLPLLVTPEDRAAVWAMMQEALALGLAHAEARVEFPGRGIRHMLLTARRFAQNGAQYLVGFGIDITDRKALEEERAEHARRLGDLSRRLVAVQEEERRRLTAELHDRTSPNLAAISLNVGMLRDRLPEDALAAVEWQIADTAALIEDTTASIRDVCADLRPVVLDYAGLVPALQAYAEQFSRRTGIRVNLHHRGMDQRLAADVESLLFRIAQEALTNCAKHAGATSVHIDLDRSAPENHTSLTIVDDGAGFDLETLRAPDRRSGHGILSMRERAEFAGGKFRIASQPGQGTEIRVEI